MSCLLDGAQICPSQTVTVGYEPQPIEELSCVSNHLQSLVCRWKNPWNPLKTNYLSTLRVENKEDKQSCLFQSPRIETYAYKNDDKDHIRVRLQNVCTS